MLEILPGGEILTEDSIVEEKNPLRLIFANRILEVSLSTWSPRSTVRNFELINRSRLFRNSLVPVPIPTTLILCVHAPGLTLFTLS